MPPVKRTDAARDEAKGVARRATLTTAHAGDVEFEVPPELPFAVVAYWTQGSFLKAITELIGEAEIPRFMDAKASMNEVRVFFDALEDVYTVPEGG